MSHSFGHGGTIHAVSRSMGVPTGELLDFSASINPLGPPPGVRQAVMNAFDQVVHYPDPEVTELRQALARRYCLPLENLRVANGSTELIHLLPRLFSGRRALIVAPPFSEYAAALEQGGWEVQYFFLAPEDGFDLSLTKLAESLAGGFDLLVIANPGNPTGALVPLEKITRLLELCRNRGTVPVIDEAFMDFCQEESAVSTLLEDGRGVILRSLTKFFALPGLRLGYAIGATGIIRRLGELIPPWSVGSLAQAAGLAALADDDYPQRTLHLIADERVFLSSSIARLPGMHPYPSAANYLLIRRTSGASVATLRGRLLHQGILIRDCGNFPALSGHFFRVAVRSRAENERLLAVLATALGA